MSEEKKPKMIVCHESAKRSLQTDITSFVSISASCAFAYWVEAGYVLQTAILAWLVVVGTVLRIKRMYGDETLLKRCNTREEAITAINAVDWEPSQ